MKKRIVKRLKLRKEIKIAIVFFMLVYIELTSVIRGLELNNEMIIFGSITLVNMMIGILLMMNKEK